jgi:acetyl-CoA synthetase
MVGLADFSDETRDWDDAARRFRFPAIDRYNIAADCLHADPAAPAILVADGTEVRTVTFGDLDSESAKVAACLQALGCTSGDRVAIKLSQSVEMAVCVLAALRAGLVVVPLSTVIGGDGIRHRLTDSVPRVLIAEGSAGDVELADLVDATLIATGPGSTARRLADVLAGPAPARPAVEPTGPDSPALLMYTSGTTGKPKGVLHGHRVLLGHHSIDYALEHIRPDDVAYSPVDWAWAGGMLLGLLVPLAHGIPVVAYRHPHFAADKVIELLRVCGVSVGLFPPTALRLLRDCGLLTDDVVGSLRIRCLVTGAEAVEPELADWVEQVLGATLNNAYGQT